MRPRSRVFTSGETVNGVVVRRLTLRRALHSRDIVLRMQEIIDTLLICCWGIVHRLELLLG
jgi:hypothetical protein